MAGPFESILNNMRESFADGGSVGLKEAGVVVDFKPYKKIIEKIKKNRPKRTVKSGSTPMYGGNKEFNKIVKELTEKGLGIRQINKGLGVGRESVEIARKNIGLATRADVDNYRYLDDPKNIKYIKKNYGIKKTKTMEKELFPNVRPTQAAARVRELIGKLNKEGKIEKEYTRSLESRNEQSNVSKDVQNRRLKKIRDIKLKRTSDPKIEKLIIKLKKGSPVDLAHLQRKTLPQTTSNIGMDIKSSNRGAMSVVEQIISNLERSNKRLYKSYKNKMPNLIKQKINSNNLKITDLVLKSKGAVVGNPLNYNTGKTNEFFGADYSRSADSGLFNTPLKKLKKDPQKLAEFLAMSKQKSKEIGKKAGTPISKLYPDLMDDEKVAAKTEKVLKDRKLKKYNTGLKQSLLKPVLKKGLKAIPLVGTFIGMSDAAKAYSGGLRDPRDLLAAYHVSPEAAFDMNRMRKDPEFAKQVQAENYSIPLDEGTYEVMEDNFTSYFNGGIVSLKGVKK